MNAVSAHWNLAQCLIWIGSHDAAKVEAPDMGPLSAVAYVAQFAGKAFSECEAALWGSLARGTISATGFNSSDELEPIAAVKWSRLSLSFSADGDAPYLSWGPNAAPLLRGDVAYRDVRIASADMMLAFPGQPTAAKARPGAKAKYDWEDAKEFARKKFEENGPFREWDTADKWKGKEDLVRLVETYMTPSDKKNRDCVPSRNAIRRYVRKWLVEFNEE